MGIVKKIFNTLHPVLKPLSQWYLSTTRKYSYDGIHIKIFPGVFHPGLFHSTKVLLKYLKTIDMRRQHVLELGAGTGLISIYCYQQGADVVASDINPTALRNIKENVAHNNAIVRIVKSDLFDHLDPHVFDLIIINPPYYPKAIQSENDLAWFCGEHFEYFKKLFCQLQKKGLIANKIVMILSEDCAIDQLSEIAKSSGLHLHEEAVDVTMLERNHIFQIKAQPKAVHT